MIDISSFQVDVVAEKIVLNKQISCDFNTKLRQNDKTKIHISENILFGKVRHQEIRFLDF